MENFTGTSLSGAEHPHFYILMEMFPKICPNYVRKLCLGKDETDEALDSLVSELLNGNYKKAQQPLSKRELKETVNAHQILMSLFPDANPVYLMDEVKNVIQEPNAIDLVVAKLLEKKKYPLKTDYLKNLELVEQEQKYINIFDMKYFLQNIPNPEEFFADRNVSYQDNDDYFYALQFLKHKYYFLHFKDIIKIFDGANCSVIQAVKILETKRSSINDNNINDCLNNQVKCKNVGLLQEIAYVQNKTDILDFIKLQKEQTKRGKKIAEEAGLFYTCECCYSEEIIPYDAVSCQSGHIFCSSCVRKSCEVIVGDGKVDFPCLTTCESQFSLKVLQSVLPQKMFSIMAQRKQMEEMRQAEIDDLVFCPFCDFATILPPQDKILRCLNEECMKETCRLCKRNSHIPLTCEEVEKQEQEVKKKAEKKEIDNRTYVEEKMTEALIRKCPKCSRSFLKESGCNKMSCSCGTLMCYVCKRQISGYDHFQTTGCPLYSDSVRLHTNDVRRGEERAKKVLKNQPKKKN